jgi:hypothetical protein
MERPRGRPGGIPCPGCPIYPHIRDEEFRFPSCELCHWPAIGTGEVHVWRCVYCRHVNEHGRCRPRISVALIRLAHLDPAAQRLQIVDARYGYYAAGAAGLAIVQPRPTAPFRGLDLRASAVGDLLFIWRELGAPFRVLDAPPHRRGPSPSARGGRPVFARATVAELPVLIVGGDRPYPHPLGLAELDPEPCSFSTRATRIACPCDQPPPCLHAQALYAHVVAPATAPWSPPGCRAQPAGGPDASGDGSGVVGATRKVTRSQATWLTTRAPIGMPAAARADQYAPATPAAPNRVKLPVATCAPA